MMATQRTYRGVALVFLCIPSFMVSGEKEHKQKSQQKVYNVVQIVGNNTRHLAEALKKALLPVAPPVKFFVNKRYLETLIRPLGYSSDADWSVAESGGNSSQQITVPTSSEPENKDNSALANLYQYTEAIATQPQPNVLQLKVIVNAETNPLVQEAARYRKLVGRRSAVAWAGLVVSVLGAAIVAPLATTEVIKRAWIVYTLTTALGATFATTLGSAGTAYYYSCCVRQLEHQLLSEARWTRAEFTLADNQSGQIISETNHNLFATRIKLNKLERTKLQQLILRVEGDTNIKFAENTQSAKGLLPLVYDPTSRIEDVLTDLLMVDGQKGTPESSKTTTVIQDDGEEDDAS